MRKVVTRWMLSGVGLAFLVTGAHAATVICQETNGSGCVANIPFSSPVIQVASDGEGGFDPFGAGFDTSDGIVLNADWVPDPAFASAFAPGFWTQIPGTFTWVLPASTPCGNENEPSCEPIAKWDFAPGSAWGPVPGVLWMLDEEGGISDIIWAINDGPNGSAAITFSSDPNLLTPEPGTLILLGIGFGLAAFGKQRFGRKSV